MEVGEESLRLFGFVGVLREGKLLGGKPRFEVAADRRPRKIVKVRDDAMRGKNGEPFARGVDEGHHGVFEGRVGVNATGAGAAFVAVSQGGFVAVVAIGNDQLLVGHGELNFRDIAGTGDDPESVDDAVFIAKLGIRSRRFRLGEDFIDAPPRIGVEHEELAGMRLRVAKQFQAVGFGTGKGLLVAKNHAGGIFFEPAGADKAVSDAALFRPGDRVLLRVSVEPRRRILPQNATGNPVREYPGGASVHVVLGRIA